MSSVDFRKCHANSAEGAALIAHALRHDGKEVNYKNKDLDTSRTHLNSIIMDSYNIGVDSFDGLLSAKDSYKALKDAVNKVDQELPPSRVRKDRVIMIAHCVAAPDGLPEEKEEPFFRIVHDEIAKFAGGHEHVTPGFIHRDEIHVYKDRITGEDKESRVHLHMSSIPFVEGKGINGKLYESRSRMRQLNQAIDKRCWKELGIKFLTEERLEANEKGKSVEDLKQYSKVVDPLKHQVKELQASISAKQNELQSLIDYKLELEKDIKLLYEEACDLSDKIRKSEKQYKKIKNADRDVWDR